jgi:hypothetical protein
MKRVAACLSFAALASAPRASAPAEAGHCGSLLIIVCTPSATKLKELDRAPVIAPGIRG